MAALTARAAIFVPTVGLRVQDPRHLVARLRLLYSTLRCLPQGVADCQGFPHRAVDAHLECLSVLDPNEDAPIEIRAIEQRTVLLDNDALPLGCGHLAHRVTR